MLLMIALLLALLSTLLLFAAGDLVDDLLVLFVASDSVDASAFLLSCCCAFVSLVQFCLLPWYWFFGFNPLIFEFLVICGCW
jgi:hypothetical protein